MAVIMTNSGTLGRVSEPTATPVTNEMRSESKAPVKGSEQWAMTTSRQAAIFSASTHAMRSDFVGC